MTQALLATGKHTVTAITRADSQSKLPEGVSVKKVDYAQPQTLVEALRGQDALIITLGGLAPKETDLKLIEAAGEAGVAWILPGEWAPDTANEDLVKDVFVFQPKGKLLLCRRCRAIQLIICSQSPKSHRRPWEEFIRCGEHRILVRMELSHRASIRL